MNHRSLIDSVAARLAAWHAGRLTRQFFRAVDRAGATQKRLLAELVSAGAESDFGRQHGFGRVRSYADFAAQVPIQTYADLAPYIDRVRRGEVQALFRPGERILMFALTSGTTAEPKYIPITRRALADWRRGWSVWGLKALLDHRECILRHIVQVTSPMEDHRSPSGVPCGAITGLLAATQRKLVLRYYTSPLAIAAIKDSAAKYYTIMRLAIPRDVSWMVTANPSTLLLLARAANEHHQLLIRDICDGTLAAEMPVDGDIRAALRPLLRPDPACAARLKAIIHQHGTLYPRHYWRLGYLAHWMGGTMGLYVPQLARYFGEVPSRDIGLIASEGRMSVPLADGTPAGVLAVTSQFFEFIPTVEYGTPKPTVLRSQEVREGEEYFLLLTNASGLYRYDIGDRVRVTGRLGEAPLIEFLSRDAHTSSLTGEKLTEDQVVTAMQHGCGGGEELVNFVLAPRWAETPYYRLYLEGTAEPFRLRAKGDQPGTVGELVWALSGPRLEERLDAALCAVSVEYASKRETLRLAPVELALLPPGFLADRDRDLRSQRSRTGEQFKHQYLLPRPDLDRDLDEAAIRMPTRRR